MEQDAMKTKDGKEISKGDVVKLRSEGPEMTVTSARSVECTCAWFVNGMYHEGTFPYLALIFLR